MAQGDLLGAVMQSDIGSGASGGVAAQSQIASVTTSPPSAEIASGSYFVYNGALYRATANISISTAITPGTNCTAVTVGGELVAQNPANWGLGTNSALIPASGADLNNEPYINTGFFAALSTATVAHVPAGAVGKNFYLETQRFRLRSTAPTDPACKQILTVDTANELSTYIRYCRNSSGTTVWSDWTLGFPSNAPAGYGLGTFATSLPSDTSLVAKTEGGWYYLTTAVVNAMIAAGQDLPMGGVSYILEVVPGNGVNQAVQYLHMVPSSDFTSTPSCVCRRFIRNASTPSVSPWEWVNPPLVAGTEYRTTERDNGNPVYKKRDSDGAIWRKAGENGTWTSDNAVVEIVDPAANFSLIGGAASAVFESTDGMKYIKRNGVVMVSGSFFVTLTSPTSSKFQFTTQNAPKVKGAIFGRVDYSDNAEFTGNYFTAFENSTNKAAFRIQRGGSSLSGNTIGATKIRFDVSGVYITNE